jgi:hypothetical protein
MNSIRLEEPEWLLPFEFMQIGDSFFVPTLKPMEMLYIIDTRSKVAKVKVKAYTSSKDGRLGVRVWRVR